MIDFVKQTDRVNAIGPNGILIAYIKKHYFGTHGHSSGWEHWIYCPDLGDFVWAGAIQVEQLGYPCFFRNVKQFKEYYAARLD